MTAASLDNPALPPTASSPAQLAPQPIAPPASQFKLALADVLDGLRTRPVWGLLGWEDIRQRYRRSTLGPLWLTISMGGMVGGLGLLYSGLFRTDIANYLPFLTLGFVVWGLMSGFVSEGCTAFIQADSVVKQVRLPLSVHVYRVVWRNLIIFAHNLLIFVVVAVVFAVWPGWAGLLALPGLALLCLNGVWIGILLGLISARFRDVPQIVASILQAAFFLTPIFWKPEHLPGRGWVVDFNPFYYLLEVVRAPLLGQVPGARVWLVGLAMAVIGCAVTFVIYARYRRRIAYWL